MEKEIIISNWHPESPNIFSSDLGWSKYDCLDAESTDPMTIFNYHWKHYRSIVFYYLKDGNFYELFMEGNPFKLWRVKQNNDWNGNWICEKIPWDNHEEGEVLFTFDDDTDLWKVLKIDGDPIGDVLKNSVIAEINI